MSEIMGNKAAKDLRAYLDRVMTLEAEKKAIGDDIGDVFKEAEGSGFDKKIMKIILKREKQGKEAVDAEQDLLDAYTAALDQLPLL